MSKLKNDLEVYRIMYEYLNNEDSRLNIEIRSGYVTLMVNAILDIEDMNEFKEYLKNKIISKMYKISKEL